MEYRIYGEITTAMEEELTGLLGEGPSSPEEPDEREPLTLRINSSGGDVFAAMNIYNKLKSYRPGVTVIIEALCASAASVIACAGRSIMARNGLYMLHNPSSLMEEGMYESSELEKRANALTAIEKAIADVYSQKTGKPLEEILRMMTDETWMTAVDAQMQHFIDEIDEMDVWVRHDEDTVTANDVSVDVSVFKKPDVVLNWTGGSDKQTLLVRLKKLFESKDDEKTVRIKQLELECEKLRAQVKKLKAEESVTNEIFALINDQLNSGASGITASAASDKIMSVVKYANGRQAK